MFAILEQRIKQIQEDLGSVAGIDPLQDRFHVGALRAYRDIIEVDFDEAPAND